MERARLHTNNAGFIPSMSKGFSLVEILIAMPVFLIFALATTGVITTTSQNARRTANSERATILAEEAIEVARNLRDANPDFATLPDGTYGLNITGNEWNLSGLSDTQNIFTRAVTISTVSEHQKKIDVTVSWSDQISPSNSVAVSTYLTNWRKITPAIGLTVNKVIINHGGTKTSSDFEPYKLTATILSGDPPSPETIELPVTLGEALALDPNTYTISEGADSNYTTTFGGDCDANGVVTLTRGDIKICTITNEEKLSYIIVNKVISGGGPFDASSFAPYKVGATTIVLETATAINSGTYIVSETESPDYTRSFSGDCNTSGQITLAPTQTKTCTITNTYAPIAVETYNITNNQGNTNYIFTGSLSGTQNDPNLTFQRGKRYIFNVNAPGQSFWIKSGRANKVIGTANAYNTGVQNNGTANGQIIFDVPLNAPASDLYYISQFRNFMSGNINTTP